MSSSAFSHYFFTECFHNGHCYSSWLPLIMSASIVLSKSLSDYVVVAFLANAVLGDETGLWQHCTCSVGSTGGPLHKQQAQINSRLAWADLVRLPGHFRLMSVSEFMARENIDKSWLNDYKNYIYIAKLFIFHFFHSSKLQVILASWLKFQNVKKIASFTKIRKNAANEILSLL